VAQARDEWRAGQGGLNPKRLVFIDETGAATDMARRYGRCPRGQRLVCSVPWGHWKTTTFVAALRIGEIAAPCVFDGPMDGPSFRAYVEQFVVPILRQDDIVMMDNLPSHKVAGIREAMGTAEHREPCESRGSCTVLGARGGEIPPRDKADACACPLRPESDH
jgi:hypothetical protein